MTNKNEMAYEKIKEGILTGEISREHPLSETMLVDKLGISRTPIRSALQRLQLEGFVKVTPNQGVVVHEISLKEATELYELRRLVEEYLIHQSVNLLKEEDFIRLEQYVDAQKAAIAKKDYHLYLKLDAEMHLYCYRKHENDAMKEILTNYRERLYPVRYRTCVKKYPRVDDHTLFIEALREQNVQKACDIMCEHISKGIMAHIL
jgi:DNA-binding GntR family transcriptional regulator